MTPAHKRDRERLALVLRSLRSIQRVVDEQAEDEALWSVPLYFDGDVLREKLMPIGEAYLQRELRSLHSVIENQYGRIRAMRKGER